MTPEMFLGFADLPPEIHSPKPFAIIGDTQRTMIAERLLLRENNDPERLHVVEALSQEDVSFIVHLGDMVASGYMPSEWVWFDHLFSKVIAAKTPVLPSLGNHDYWGNPTAGFEHARRRFPQLKNQRWFTRIYNDVGLVWLDTNANVLGRELCAEQIAWFEATLKFFEQDDKIKSILVFGHHPPFSNSLITGDSHHIQWQIVPLLSNAPKTKALFSGHAHGYERFVMQEKSYVISAGGGGPRQPMRRGRAAKHRDHCLVTGPRPFNYLLVNIMGPKIHVTVKALAKGSSDIRIYEEFDL